MKLIRLVDPNTFYPIAAVLRDDGNLIISFRWDTNQDSAPLGKEMRDQDIEDALIPFMESHPTEVAFVLEKIKADVKPEAYTVLNGEYIDLETYRMRYLEMVANRPLRQESIYIGTKQQITDMIMSDPRNYRQAGSYTLESQLNKIIAGSPNRNNVGLVFMLGDNTDVFGGFRIDKWWVSIQEKATEAALEIANSLR